MVCCPRQGMTWAVLRSVAFLEGAKTLGLAVGCQQDGRQKKQERCNSNHGWISSLTPNSPLRALLFFRVESEPTDQRSVDFSVEKKLPIF